MFTTTAAAAGANPLHVALTDLLAEVSEGSVKHICMASSDGNWRTRQVVRELKGLKSLEDLFLSEEQIRGVVVSQETRRRVKILNAFLLGQFFTEEQESVREEERRCRQSLTHKSLSVLNKEATFLTLIGEEMHGRHSLEKLFMVERVHCRNYLGVEMLVLSEQSCRRSLEQTEIINRVEIERRRFLAVGREIDMELLRQQFYRVASWAYSKTTKFILDISILVTEEERDRCSLERLYLLQLALIANDQENAAARLVVNSVMRASLMRRRLRDDSRWREFASKLLILPSKESDIRCIIERKEMEERQEVRVRFMITWREIFKRLGSPLEEYAIVASLELYERRCLFDQWRFGFNALYEQQQRERRVLVRREAACDVFFNACVDSLTALWKQECEQFNRIRKLYSDFVCSSRMLQAEAVLSVEEYSARRRIIESEVRDRVKAQVSLCICLCERAALREAVSIMKMEDSCRLRLMQWCFNKVEDFHFDNLHREEESFRLDIVSEASAEWADIVLKENASLGRSVASFARLEGEQRAFIMEQEYRHFVDSCLQVLAYTEHTERGILRRNELSHRILTSAFILGNVEAWNRLELDFERQRELLSIALSCLSEREQIKRRVIKDCESQRRNFLFDDFDYSLPYLRACEVDEIDARLGIIHEAELAMSALAYMQGMQWRPIYHSEEMYMIRNAMHFMSLAELLQHYEIEMVRVVEPMSRGNIIAVETVERLTLAVEAQEHRGRIRIEEKARDAYRATHELFDRIILRADQWRTRGVLRDFEVLSGREALMDYFRRHEALFAVKLKAQREKTRKLLATFFENFYWSRDTIVIEEFVARDGIMCSFQQPQRTFYGLAQRPPSQLTVRFYSLALTTDVELNSLFLKVYDSVDDEGLTFELQESQAIRAAGRVFRNFIPLRLVEWVRLLTVESNVLYFEARDLKGEVTATASLFLRSEDLRRTTGASLVSVSLDDGCGKINVLLYVE